MEVTNLKHNLISVANVEKLGTLFRDILTGECGFMNGDDFVPDLEFTRFFAYTHGANRDD